MGEGRLLEGGVYWVFYGKNPKSCFSMAGAVVGGGGVIDMMIPFTN